MDITALASVVMNLLTSLAPVAGTAIATKIGEDAYSAAKDQIRRLYEAVRKRFAHEQDGGKATQALQTFVEEGDLDYQSVVNAKLIRILQLDPDFARELSQFLQNQQVQQIVRAAEEAQVSDVHMENSLGRGQQEVDAGMKATVTGITMHIGQEKSHS